jgi:hypothetical protein
MNVTVMPEEFQFVFFDASAISDIACGLIERMGLADHPLSIVVDETTPLNRVWAAYDNGIEIKVESGAFEDTRQPRHLSPVATATTLGRALFKVRDRIDGSFGEAPPEDDLQLAHIAAWDAYCLGRFAALGLHPVNQQRWRYNFRNRHGFSDAVDELFDQYWGAERMTWAELQAMSDEIRAVTAAVTV